MLQSLKTAVRSVKETDERHPKGAGIHRYGAALQSQHLPPLESLLISPESIRQSTHSHPQL